MAFVALSNLQIGHAAVIGSGCGWSYPQVSGFSIRKEKGRSDEAKTETWGEEFSFEVWMRGRRNSQLNYWLTLLLDWRLPKA